MIIQLQTNTNTGQLDALMNKIQQLGYKSNEVKTQSGHYIICIGKKNVDIRLLGNLPGVKDIHKVSDDYKLVSRKWKVKDTIVDLGDGVTIGRDNLSIMAGPCAIESREQTLSTVEHLKKNKIKILRGGVFKPRSSPYAFRGVGIDGLKELSAICKENGIKIATEVMQVSQIKEMIDYVDVFQVGARNSQNFNLLDALGEIDKPVLLKRGMSGTIDELLYSAEYIFSAGNEKIILCERGIRTYEKAYRNTFDVNAIAILKDKTHLPVVADPSHGIGIRQFVGQVALAAVIAGADGVLLEVHETPEEALSDGQQTLSYQEAEELYVKLKQVYSLGGK
jgi:3-deoxy-7-phosphoheptulonate synthase